mgnify:CR=1 FL=1
MAGEDSSENEQVLIPDILQANDWRFGRFATYVIILQIITFLIIFLDDNGLISLNLRGLFTFLFYSYVPGLVLLRVLRMHRLGGVLTTLLSVAASVAIMMFTGLILNLMYFEMNGSLPFTFNTIVNGLTVIFVSLLLLSFITNRHYCDRPTLDISPFITAPAFALYSLPLLAILATYLLNGWNIAWLQIVLIIAIAAAVMALLIKRVPSQLYPVAVICIALAVLFHTSLVSRFVVEWADISFEYWSANKTLIDGFWTMDSPNRTDSVLSVTILAPIYNLLTGLDLNTIFKACYPILFTLVPLGVFHIARERLDSRGALLAAFLIISGEVFFTEFLGLARQIVAELLLMSVVALLLNRSNMSINKIILTWFLALGMIVSHYGLIVVIMPAAITSSILFLLLERRSLTASTVVKLVGSAALIFIPPIMWYGNISGSAVLNSMREHIEQLFDGSLSIGLYEELIPILSLEHSHHLWPVFIMAILASVLCICGLAKLISSRHELDDWVRSYVALATPFLIYIFIAFFDTKIFDFITIPRFLHICLLFTAPLAVFGTLSIHKLLKKFISSENVKRPTPIILGAIAVVFFLTVSGIGNSLVGSPLPTELDLVGSDAPNHNDGSFIAAAFAVEKGIDAGRIYADAHRAYLLHLLSGRYDPLFGRDAPPLHSSRNTHYFLSSENLEGMIWLENPNYYRINKNYVPIGESFTDRLLIIDKVYASQESELYYKKL